METIAIARDLVRRGLDADALQGFRIGQNIGWQRWMELAFELTSDPGELRELLDVTARSIFGYVDEILIRITEQVERERDQLTRGTHVQRLEAVSLILEGAPIASARASTRLGYELERFHTAAIVWSHPARDADPADLEARGRGDRPRGRRAPADRRGRARRRSGSGWPARAPSIPGGASGAARATRPASPIALGPTEPGHSRASGAAISMPWRRSG